MRRSSSHIGFPVLCIRRTKTALAYLCRNSGSISSVSSVQKNIAGITADEREVLIDMKTASATLKGAAVLYAAVNIPLAVYAFSFPQMILRPPYHIPPVSVPLVSLGSVALVELILLAVVLFLYVGFHVYYAKKYGGDCEDEE